MFMARGLHFGSTHTDNDEFIENGKIPIDLLVEQIMNGNIKDGKTQAAVLKAYKILKSEKERKK